MTAVPLDTASNESHMAVKAIADKIQQGKEEVTARELTKLKDIVAKDTTIIPVLDRKFLNQSANTTIVRYVGMVQDMLEVEYYLSECDGVKTHFREYTPQSSDHLDAEGIDIAHKLAERQPLVVVPIPFASKWLAESTNEPPMTSEVNSSSAMAEEEEPSRCNKRSLEDDHGAKAGSSGSPVPKKQVSDVTSFQMAPAHMARPRTVHTDEAAPIATHTRLPISQINMVFDDEAEDQQQKQDAATENRPFDVDAADSSASLVSQVIPSPQADNALNTNDWWPAGTLSTNENESPILVKLYYDHPMNQDDERRLQLNQVVEFVGVLSMNPMSADFGDQSGGNGLSHEECHSLEQDMFIDQLVLPPPSRLPRLHVLSFRTLNLEEIKSNKTESAMDVEPTETVPDGRNQAISLFSKQVFGGKEAASEALLMVLMSMAERENITGNTWSPVKTPSDTTLGCASLNLVLPNVQSCKAMEERLHMMLQELVPVVATVSLEDLGKSLVSPAKTDSGRLNPSPLQLPKGAVLIVNESTLCEGPIGPRPQETLSALSSLSRGHSIPYRFDGLIKYTFEADYRIIVLSTGTSNSGKKLLPCTLKMKIDTPVAVQEDSVSQDIAASARAYFETCRSPGDSPTNNISLSKDILEEAQNTFIQRRVAARQNNTKEAEEEDFHTWLTLTRLQTRSRSSQCATLSDWKASLLLDDAMKSE